MVYISFFFKKKSFNKSCLCVRQCLNAAARVARRRRGADFIPSSSSVKVEAARCSTSQFAFYLSTLDDYYPLIYFFFFHLPVILRTEAAVGTCVVFLPQME